MLRHFVKMDGLGNDFVIMDARSYPYEFSPSFIQRLCDRRRGVGCDQFILLCDANDPKADARMRIFNPDGSEAEMCGNAARCVAWLLAQKEGKAPILQTCTRLLETDVVSRHCVQVMMGKASFAGQDFSLSPPLDLSTLSLTFKTLADPVVVNVGNSHLIFFVEDFSMIDMEKLGSTFNQHPLFPGGVNVEVATVPNYQTLVVKVYERGTGITPACGSGACATAAAAFRHGLVQKKVSVHLDGGVLEIENLSSGDLRMTGPVEFNFEGTLGVDFFS